MRCFRRCHTRESEGRRRKSSALLELIVLLVSNSAALLPREREAHHPKAGDDCCSRNDSSDEAISFVEVVKICNGELRDSVDELEEQRRRKNHSTRLINVQEAQ